MPDSRDRRGIVRLESLTHARIFGMSDVRFEEGLGLE